jgi:hypothetical protein
MAIVVFPLSSPRFTVRLTGESSCEEVDSSPPNSKVCCSDVFMLIAIREMMIHYLVAKRIDLTMHQVLPAHPVRRKGKTANSVKEMSAGHNIYRVIELTTSLPNTSQPLNMSLLNRPVFDLANSSSFEGLSNTFAVAVSTSSLK